MICRDNPHRHQTLDEDLACDGCALIYHANGWTLIVAHYPEDDESPAGWRAQVSGCAARVQAATKPCAAFLALAAALSEARERIEADENRAWERQERD